MGEQSAVHLHKQIADSLQARRALRQRTRQWETELSKAHAALEPLFQIDESLPTEFIPVQRDAAGVAQLTQEAQTLVNATAQCRSTLEQLQQSLLQAKQLRTKLIIGAVIAGIVLLFILIR